MVDGGTMFLFPPYTPIFLMVSEMRPRALTETCWKSFSELNEGAEAVMAGWGEEK